ncbi:DUF3365 domain-containing protein [bacterium]|nr:DUF3365 domain-containing protein [bacterium]
MISLRTITISTALLGIGCGALATLAGCGSSETVAAPTRASEAAKTEGISPQTFADSVHAVMMADRTVYAKHVVTRLKKQNAPVAPSEYWEDEEHKIPLPAQMFRMGAELVAENPEAGFSYALKSKWPLNPQNKAVSPMEIEGLEFVAENPGKNFYGEEKIGDKTYYTAVYPDKAVAQACWECHNNHQNREADYPDFKEGDVMGGVIVRVPLNK